MKSEAMSYEQRMKWFNEARFGMFIHWGLYSILARGEWVMHQERIPAEEYAKLAEQFCARNFNADRWAELAREAGMKYMVLTTRHHDGFCLFDSQVSDFTSVKSAARRDFVAEYVEACRRADLRVCLYYSLLDWRFPGYFDRKKHPDSFAAMVAQAHAQVRELMTNYGKIDMLFWDGGWVPGSGFDGSRPVDVADLWRSKELSAMVRRLQPHIIINDRSGLPEDYDTPEQEVKSSQAGRCWQSCMTIGDRWGWGYIRNNPNMKSVTQLIQYLVHCVAGGGNYLLNVGPRADGTIRPEESERLRLMGDWLRVNGEGIYGCGRCPFDGGIIGVTTARANTAYLHVFRWPGEEACIAGVKNEVKSARVLCTGQRAEVEKKESGRLFIRGLPFDPPDAHDTVIALELDGEPEAAGQPGQ